jgi:hypothetical protein
MDGTAKRVITYDKVSVTCWRYDPELERVVAAYETLDTKGAVIERGEAIFWATLPVPTMDTDGKSLEYPANWHQLDAKFLQGLQDCTASMQATLTPILAEEKVEAIK